MKPFLDLIVQCLDCSENVMISNALKVIHCVIKWPIMKHRLKSIFDTVLQLLEKLSLQDLELTKPIFALVQDLLEIK